MIEDILIACNRNIEVIFGVANGVRHTVSQTIVRLTVLVDIAAFRWNHRHSGREAIHVRRGVGDDIRDAVFAFKGFLDVTFKVVKQVNFVLYKLGGCVVVAGPECTEVACDTAHNIALGERLAIFNIAIIYCDFKFSFVDSV